MFEAKKEYSYKVYTANLEEFLGILGSIGVTFEMSREGLESTLRNGKRYYRIFTIRANKKEHKLLESKLGR